MSLLDDVKTALNVVDDQADGLLQLHIDTVREYLKGAGVPSDIIDGTAAKGCIIRGVIDLWNAGAGETTFSQAFKDMAIQLAVSYQENKG